MAGFAVAMAGRAVGGGETSHETRAGKPYLEDFLIAQNPLIFSHFRECHRHIPCPIRSADPDP